MPDLFPTTDLVKLAEFGTDVVDYVISPATLNNKRLIMPEFFVPAAEDREQSERVWQSTRDFMRQQGFQTTGRRIYSM
jgi:hypothetical protein